MAVNSRSVRPQILKALAGSAVLSIVASNASATWSILIADTRTGEIVIASATCVESIDLRRETPVLITGVGAVTAQSAVDSSGRNRLLIRDRLLQGVPLEAIFEELAMTDPGHANRQYGFITAGGQTLTYSGVQNADWAGGITGRIEKGRPGPADDIVYSVQGNILSGPNVVQDAVNAIIAADDTDLPGRLMAGMLAGRFGGGDGRCSCSPANPTGCGSPPPGDFKSADVGYMLGTRADNIDAVRVSYPTTNAAGGLALIDLDHDGMKDVLIGDSVIDEISVFMNSALPGDPLSHVLPQPTISVGAAGSVEIGVGDLNNDGFDDVAIALKSPPTLSVLLGQPEGGLSDPINIALAAIPSGLAVGDLIPEVGGDEIVVSMGSIGTLGFYLMNGGELTSGDTIALDGNPTGVILEDLVGDSAPDLAVARRDSDQVWIGENQGNGLFGEAANLATANEPNRLAVGDFDLDGDNELVVLTDSSRRAQVFGDDGTSWVMTNEIIINRNGRGLVVGSFTDGDDFPDIITASSSPQRNMQLFINDGAGGFTLADRVRVGSGARYLALEDMNANGNLDLVIANGGTDGLELIDNPRGGHIPQPGRFADGDYFLELNIPNQRMDDPDPVEQLQALFNIWRDGLEGKIDAVHSMVSGRSRVALGTSSTITVDLRDWRGDPLAIKDPGGWSLSSTYGLFSVSNPVMVSPGVFELTVDAGEAIGTDTLIIRVGDGADQVRLMPDFGVFALENIADFTADGILNFFDVSAFLVAFYSESPDADLSGDGVLNFNDVFLFLAAFNG